MISRRVLLAAIVPASSDLVVYRNGRIVVDEWRGGLDGAVRPGSLWKPFLAAAAVRPAEAVCTGAGCWRRHGRVQLVEAIALSCNRWFDSQEFDRTALSKFGLSAGERNWSAWPSTPRQLALAYAELLARRADHPSVEAGLRLAAERGTASALGPGFLAKTGTSASERHAGDGWVFAAWGPALAIYRQHGVPGSVAARSLKARIAKERW